MRKAEEEKKKEKKKEKETLDALYYFQNNPKR